MIDIPERVQDALRDGRYLKNYKFFVPEGGEPVETWETVFYHELVTEPAQGQESDEEYWFTVQETGLYRLYSDRGVSSDLWVFFIYESEGETPIDFKTLYSGNTIDLISGRRLQFVGSTYDLTLQMKTIKNEDITIENDHLVKESVHFDERMCSDETIKFGLCEGTTLEFQYFGYPNIVGKRVHALLDIQYKDENKELKWFKNLPMGWFDVDECSMQFATKIRKCKAYNKLKSKYLDAKANELIEQEFGDHDGLMYNEAYLCDILDLLLQGYGVHHREYKGIVPSSTYWKIDTSSRYTHDFWYTMLPDDHGMFGSAILPSTVTTSKRIYMSATADEVAYYIGSDSPYYNKPIRIRSDWDLNAVDDAIANFIKDNIENPKLNIRLQSSHQPDDNHRLYLSLVGMKSEAQSVDIDGFFFQIVVNCGDSTGTKTYKFGKTLTGKKSGDFDKLKHMTFYHVKSIYIYSPESINFGLTIDSSSKKVTDYYERTAPDGVRKASNRVKILGSETGATYSYIYKDFNNNVIWRDYKAASLDDGTVIPEHFGLNEIKVCEVDGISEAEMTLIDLETMADVTLRELQTAAFETQCQFGKLDRETDLFSGVELNQERLFPAEDLYPREDLYPAGGQEGSFKSQYSKLWFDEGGIDTWKYLIITYKGLEEDEQGNPQEKDFTLQRTINPDGTTNYNMSDNWLFRNLIWTEEQVGEYADKMVAKMRGITWFPFEMWAAGLPYIETGDEIEINAYEETHVSYVLQRQLRGIQNLQDTFINGQLDIF